MRTAKVIFILVIYTFALALSTSPVVADNPFEVKDPQLIKNLEIQAQNSEGGRVMVVTNGPVTESVLEELSKHGKIHLVIQRYNIVSMTPKGKNELEVIENLDFVTLVTKDHPMHSTNSIDTWDHGKINMVEVSSGPALGIGSWDRDMINVVEMSSGAGPADPDTRNVDQDGEGVYVAVLDSGLPPDWRDWLVAEQVRDDLARSFIGRGAVDDDGVPADPKKEPVDPPDKWQKDTSGHGLAVISHIIGFRVGSGAPILVDGVAPKAKIIPLKIFPNGQSRFFESQLIAALAYVTGLDLDGPLVINMSLGGPDSQPLTEMVIDDAIASGAILVAAAGNRGEDGMDYPAAYGPVISVGAVGYTRQWRNTFDDEGEPDTRFWQLENVPENDVVNYAYVASLSSRDLQNAELLDVVAPGRATFGVGNPPHTERVFLEGTSFATPLVAGVAALMLQKANGNLVQGDVETILKNTAAHLESQDSREDVLDDVGPPNGFQVITKSWDNDCNGGTDNCDPVGSGLVQADAALTATP